MPTSEKAETLRLLLRTAKSLRAVAAVSLDADETDLFLRGAVTLEKRAQALAYRNEAVAPEIPMQIDLVC